MRKLNDIEKKVLGAAIRYEEYVYPLWRGPNIYFSLFPNEKRFATNKSGVGPAIQRLKRLGFVARVYDQFQLTPSGRKKAEMFEADPI